MTEKNIVIRSEEVQEILDRIPNWLIRWGITVLLFFVISVLIVSWVIKYPDVITARVVLTTETPPIHMVAGSSGLIDLLTQDEQEVKKGDLLAVIENTANTEDIVRLIDQLENLRNVIYKEPFSLKSVEVKSTLNLGQLQQYYFNFISELENFDRFNTLAVYENQRLSFLDRINHYEKLGDVIYKQLEFISEEVKISEQFFRDDSILFEQGAGIKTEKNRSKSNYLLKKRNRENLQSSLIQNSLQIAELKSKLIELKLEEKSTYDNLVREIIQNFETLESRLEDWKKTYLIRAPIEGKLSFFKFWSDNQYVNDGEIVMTIIPESEGIVGQVTIPIEGSGKVEVGQQVNIKLDNYPYKEYGMLIGQVQTISLIPRDNTYKLQVRLTDDLTSTFNKELSFKQEMQGSGEIITQNKRLIERIFSQLKNILNRVE